MPELKVNPDFRLIVLLKPMLPQRTKRARSPTRRLDAPHEDLKRHAKTRSGTRRVEAPRTIVNCETKKRNSIPRRSKTPLEFRKQLDKVQIPAKSTRHEAILQRHNISNRHANK